VTFSKAKDSEETYVAWRNNVSVWTIAILFNCSEFCPENPNYTWNFAQIKFQCMKIVNILSVSSDCNVCPHAAVLSSWFRCEKLDLVVRGWFTSTTSSWGASSEWHNES
jgi:hypothetical protein